MDSTTSNPPRYLAYAQDVVSGRIIAGSKVILSCRRFLHDLEQSKDPAYPWQFDENRAQRPITFMERFLTPTKGAYDRMTLQPWQCFVEANIYGWVSKETGLRRFNEALIGVGRGNGKTTLQAGNASFGVAKDGERGPDIFLLANSKEQAGILFNECAAQIKTSSALDGRFKVLRDKILYEPTNGSIMHRASDSRKLDGLNPHMAIFDEIHEYRTFKLINVMRRGMNKRQQPLAIYITTMGTVLDGPLMYYYDLFSKALIPPEEGGLALDVADRMFAFICELDDEKEIEQPETWIKANPSIGVLLSLEKLKADWERCKSIPQERIDFVTKQLNFFANASEAAFVDYPVIQRNRGSYPEEALAGKLCYGGFDLSTSEDFTSACLEFPLDDGRLFILSHSWAPEKKARLNQEKIPYFEWAMAGHLTLCPGEYINYDLLLEWFEGMAKKYRIKSIGYDPANATLLVRTMQSKYLPVAQVRQGPLTLNGPMKDIRQRLLDGQIITNNNPMFLWYLSNVKLRNDFYDKEKENWMPSKRDRYHKIDGFAAFLDAHTEFLRLHPLPGVPQAQPNVRVFNLFDLLNQQ